MTISSAICNSFKQEILVGTHNFTASSGNAFKLALFAEGSGGKSSTTATLGAATTAFVTTGEVASSGTYATGGGALTKVAPNTSGTTAFTEMRIAGNANAYWDYNTATAAKIASGAMTTYAPIAGGNRTAIGDGYSVIELTIPAGATQLAFNLNCRMNSAGEEWWIDNAELIQLGPCVVLPIELPDAEFGIYETTPLLKLLNILKSEKTPRLSLPA